MKSKNKIIIFSLLILVLSISAVSAHENVITDGNDAINDIISIDKLDDGFDDGLDDDSDDSDDWDDDSDDGLDDSDDWDDYDDEDWDDDSDDWDDYDDEDWDDYDDEDWYDDWDGNYTNSSVKFHKLIAYYCGEPLIAYKTTSAPKNMTCGDLASEDDHEDIYDDSQEESNLEDSQSFITPCFGSSASFEIPDVLSKNQGSVSKSINQGQNLLDDEKENDVNFTDDKDYDAITFSSDNDLSVLGLLLSLLLCILLLI